MTEDDEDADYSNYCKPVKPWKRLFTMKLAVHPAMNMCQKMNGTLAVISDSETEKEFSHYLVPIFETNPGVLKICNIDSFETDGPAMILAQHKTLGTVEEAPVRNPYTGEVITYENWLSGYPNRNFQDKGEYWHTWIWRAGASRIMHRSNTYSLCFVCDGGGSTVPVLRVRGLCQKSQFDRKFVIASNTREVLFLQGDRHTNITYDRVEKKWVMTSMRKMIEYETGGRDHEATQPVRATSKAKIETLLLGKHEFTFASDEKCTDKKDFTSRILITTCPEEDFTCGDGLCVSMAKRCDKIIDCINDSADEEDCNMVQFDQTYKKEFAPVKVDESGEIVKTVVNVSVDLLTILKVSEVESLFSCQLRLFLTWMDQRLQFNNLKMESNQNSLSLEEKDALWIPRVIFENTELRNGIINDDKSSVTIDSLGDFEVAKDDTLDNTMIFKGGENPITLARAYKSK